MAQVIGNPQKLRCLETEHFACGFNLVQAFTKQIVQQPTQGLLTVYFVVEERIISHGMSKILAG